jgi:hypothetical protein
MGRGRLLVVCMSVLALGASSAPAGAATPSLKAQFAPVNLQIKRIGGDIATAVNGVKSTTNAQIVKEFSGLAQRTAAASAKVSKLEGATGGDAVTQRRLQLALANGALDLARIATYSASRKHAKVTAATAALVKDSVPIRTSRAKLAKSLGLTA